MSTFYQRRGAARLDRAMLRRLLDQAADIRTPEQKGVAIALYDPRLAEFQALHAKAIGTPWDRIRRAIEGRV